MDAPHPSEAWLVKVSGQSGPWADAEAVRRWQLGALRSAFRHAAANSAFYRERLAGLPRRELADGLWPADFDAFHRAPFTWPEELHADWRRFLCVSLGEVARMVSLETSGTTAGPKRVAFSNADLERIVAYFAQGVGHMVRPGDTVLILLPAAERPASVTRLLTSALPRVRARGVAGSHLVEEAGFAMEMERHRPQVLVAAPAQLERLSEYTALQPLLRKEIRTILSCTMPMEPGLKERLTQAWDTVIQEYYGLTESGYCGGIECRVRDGYHLDWADLYFEVVDPLTGAPVPDGQPGEVTLTTLTREAMPLIRYRTGDYAAMLPGPCGCGSALRRLGLILGRIERTPGGFRLANVQKGAYRVRHLGGNL